MGAPALPKLIAALGYRGGGWPFLYGCSWLAPAFTRSSGGAVSKASHLSPGGLIPHLHLPPINSPISDAPRRPLPPPSVLRGPSLAPPARDRGLLGISPRVAAPPATAPRCLSLRLGPLRHRRTRPSPRVPEGCGPPRGPRSRSAPGGGGPDLALPSRERLGEPEVRTRVPESQPGAGEQLEPVGPRLGPALAPRTHRSQVTVPVVATTAARGRPISCPGRAWPAPQPPSSGPRAARPAFPASGRGAAGSLLAERLRWRLRVAPAAGALRVSRGPSEVTWPRCALAPGH